MLGRSPSSSSPTPAEITSSANAGIMWPMAKIVRAIVGEPPESSRTRQVDLGGRVEVQPPQRAGGDHGRHQRLRVDVGRPAGLDQDLAEQDDQKQPEALGEVVWVKR